MTYHTPEADSTSGRWTWDTGNSRVWLWIVVVLLGSVGVGRCGLLSRAAPVGGDRVKPSVPDSKAGCGPVRISYDKLLFYNHLSILLRRRARPSREAFREKSCEVRQLSGHSLVVQRRTASLAQRRRERREPQQPTVEVMDRRRPAKRSTIRMFKGARFWRHSHGCGFSLRSLRPCARPAVSCRQLPTLRPRVPLREGRGPRPWSRASRTRRWGRGWARGACGPHRGRQGPPRAPVPSWA